MTICETRHAWTFTMRGLSIPAVAVCSTLPLPAKTFHWAVSRDTAAGHFSLMQISISRNPWRSSRVIPRADLRLVIPAEAGIQGSRGFQSSGGNPLWA